MVNPGFLVLDAAIILLKKLVASAIGLTFAEESTTDIPFNVSVVLFAADAVVLVVKFKRAFDDTESCFDDFEIELKLACLIEWWNVDELSDDLIVRELLLVAFFVRVRDGLIDKVLAPKMATELFKIFDFRKDEGHKCMFVPEHDIVEAVIPSIESLVLLSTILDLLFVVRSLTIDND